MSATATAPEVATRTPRPRLFYLDLVRAIATVLIVITHFNNPYLLQSSYVLAMAPFGIYIGDLGVSLFLVISGAALMVSHGSRLDVRSFYWKRFKTIYPMFWIAWTIATLYFFLLRAGSPVNPGPSWSFVFTVFGVDGLVANFQIPTMYLLGEWFLGFIVIFYLVFPLLRWGVIKHPLLTFAAIAVLYALTLWFFVTPRTFPSGIILTARLPELAFGMYLAYYWKRLPAWSAIPAVFVLALWGLETPTLPGATGAMVGTTLVGISAFVILVLVARFVDAKPVRAVVALIATYSYAIFLVHHVVIMRVFELVDEASFGRMQVHVLFAATSLLIFGLAFALFRLDQNVVRFFTSAFDGVRIGRRTS